MTRYGGLLSGSSLKSSTAPSAPSGSRSSASASASPMSTRTTALADEVRRRQTWQHFKQDGHPTADGHVVIARAVLRGLVEQGFVQQPADH